MADLAERYGAWFHVDGAFWLFAALSPRTKHLVEGVARADSVIADGHKWLNVPYENGFAFVLDPALLPAVFGTGAPYLPDINEPQPNWGYAGRRCLDGRGRSRCGRRSVPTAEKVTARSWSTTWIWRRTWRTWSTRARPGAVGGCAAQHRVLPIPAARVGGRPGARRAQRSDRRGRPHGRSCVLRLDHLERGRGVPPRAREPAYAGAGRGTRGRRGARARRSVHRGNLKNSAGRPGRVWSNAARSFAAT
jgi:Pyridoxal-dependent decarboxylase conserved domain